MTLDLAPEIHIILGESAKRKGIPNLAPEGQKSGLRFCSFLGGHGDSNDSAVHYLKRNASSASSRQSRPQIRETKRRNK